MGGSSNPIYAHTLGPNQANWEPLPTHAAEVAKRAGDFAAAFDARDWGRLLGLWHDLGKRSAEFQAHLVATADLPPAERPPGPDHSTFGARHAAQTVGKHFGQLLAFCIAGHHGRMLSSALVDADRTATEAFCDPPRASERAATKRSPSDLRQTLDAFLRWKGSSAPPAPVNRMRPVVLRMSRPLLRSFAITLSIEGLR